MAREPDDVDAMVEPVVPSRHRWLAGLLVTLDRLADVVPLRRVYVGVIPAAAGGRTWAGKGGRRGDAPNCQS